MKLPINIHDLLTARTVEWERLEFKAGWNPKAVLRTMCAFANDFYNLGGGYIIIGVDEDNGRPVLPPAGLPAKQIDAIQKEIVKLGYRMVPYYHPIIAPYEADGKHILVLWAKGGQTRPYKAPVSLAKGEREFAYYIRKGSVTVRAGHRDETELMSLAASIPFDDRLNQHTTLENLDLGLMRAYLKQIKSDLFRESSRMDFSQLCRQMNVFLKELEMTEGRGTGIPKMLREIKKNGSPQPEFHTDKDRTFFLVEFPIHPVFAEALKQKTAREVTPEVTPEVKRLLNVITGDHSRRELQKMLGLKDPEHFRKAYLLPAIDGGLVEMTLPDKPKSRLQRYRLTESGQTFQQKTRKSNK